MTEVEKNISDMKIEENNVKEGEEDIVDPWNVVSKSDAGIDYEKLISNMLSFIIFE